MVMTADSWERQGPVVAWPVSSAGRKAARYKKLAGRRATGAPGGHAADGLSPRVAVPSLLRRYARHALSVAVLATAAYFLAAHARDIRAASHLLSGIRWPWVFVAVACEAVSMLVFARLQRRLLR